MLTRKKTKKGQQRQQRQGRRGSVSNNVSIE